MPAEAALRPATDSRHGCRRYPNLLRAAAVERLDRARAADLTYIRRPTTFVYPACLLDAHSRRGVGRHLARQIDTRLTLAALDRALAAGRPAPGLSHHSDQGVQYASADYVARLTAVGARISMAATGNPYANAKAESVFKTLKRAEVYLKDYRTFEEAQAHLARFIDDVYNTKTTCTTPNGYTRASAIARPPSSRRPSRWPTRIDLPGGLVPGVHSRTAASKPASSGSSRRPYSRSSRARAGRGHVGVALREGGAGDAGGLGGDGRERPGQQHREPPGGEATRTTISAYQDWTPAAGRSPEPSPAVTEVRQLHLGHRRYNRAIARRIKAERSSGRLRRFEVLTTRDQHHRTGHTGWVSAVAGLVNRQLAA